jgi:putative hydrolase of the HAD superfamily
MVLRGRPRVAVAQLTTIFWDIGGVILTNGWDMDCRKAAAEIFQLDWNDFEGLHDASFADWETGRITLDQYLERTVFRQPRPFSREEFTAFIFAQSQEYPQSRAVLTELARRGQFFIGAINNEPLELNQYRIQKFKLRSEFTVFFSSCYVGTRKPDEDIFRIALQVTQKLPAECLFIDDREVNLASPRRMGLGTIHYQNPEQLRGELAGRGAKLNA